MTDDTRLDAPITGVTVFRDGARVVRRGRITLRPGTATVVLGDLPASVDPESVRIVARGEHVALLEVEVQRGYRSEPLREEIGRLRAEVERHRETVQSLEDEDTAEDARLSYFASLSEASATALSRAVSFGRLERSELTRMADMLASGTSEALGRRRDIKARRRVARRQLEAAEQLLAQAEERGERSVEYSDVLATLEVTAETDGEVEVSYHAANASWRPLYDLRVEGEKLLVSYLAEITQRTGEDWPETELTLSTVRQAAHKTIPELHPWYVGRPPQIVRGPPRAAAAPAQGGDSGAYPDEDTLMAFSVEELRAPLPAALPRAAAPLVAEAFESGAALVYRVARPLAVPSDGAPHKTTVARFELDSELDHVTVPVLAPEAYLRATVTNSSDVLLLPGPANVFHDAEYVGATSLETVAPGEEFELQLGVDDRIRVQRDLRRRTTGKAILGGTRSIDVAYEIVVQNHRSAVSKIKVQDHIPLSRDGDIKVRLRDVSPKPAEQDDLGVLSWEVELGPGEKSSIRFAFTVEHPGGSTVIGL